LNAPVLEKQLISNALSCERSRYFHQRYEIPDDHLIFVYLGILGSGRGIEICLEAFANGPTNAHAVFIGFGNLKAKVLDFANRYPNVHFHPAVQHDQVVSLVSNADFGLCLVENSSLSDYYCLPNKLFEYCFARLPVLASNFPEISRLVNEFSLGFCCDPSPNSVRLALANIVATRPVLTAKNVTDLSWETQADRLRDVYHRHLFRNLGAV
jgi:glycosyltransferase involved in cell wall biosynthesis